MFCGSLPETSDVIEIPDIEVDALKQFVRFLYTGEVAITGDTVMPLLYAAKKYDVDNLRDKCPAFLENSISTENVRVLLSQALQFGEKKLRKQCLQFIAANASEVLKSDEVCQLPKQHLQSIVKRSDLKSSELSIHEACKRWAKVACQSNGQDATDYNVREALGDVIYLIGFPSMDAKEFCTHVTNDDILSKSEITDIYRDILMKSNSTNFNKTLRRKFETWVVTRSTGVLSGWGFNGKNQDGISFRVSKPVTLVAILCYLPSAIRTNMGPLQIFEEKACLLTQNIQLNFKSGTKFESVCLDQKVNLVPGKQYSICQKLSGITAFYGNDCHVKCFANDITVEFMDLIREVGISNNSTSVKSGQFHGLLFEC